MTVTLRLTPAQLAYLRREADDLDVTVPMLAGWIAEDAIGEAARTAAYCRRLDRKMRRRPAPKAGPASDGRPLHIVL